MTHIIAVTACPSGVAHTYMAAESLEGAAKAKGWQIKVETQGSIGIENELTAEDVARGRYRDPDQGYRHQV
ncbi:Fructose-like phosphotransferase enzyme IIB component 1 [Raoultella terrigena]|uniref:protein-N(pi)-phosphohistidine--D-fructose phosphotransferase n=1 Tax=Raoultella terrigena TaxID=577 RepID=A0A3P8JND2_RAOTE|nr:Fructose-like phosphotransferase enzyme IIB component 1 [Raoultella terrigena]